MSSLPSQQLLASYWIPNVGIGNPMQNVQVPLLDVANYVLQDGSPQTNVVFLFAAAFTGTPDSFAPPYFSIPDDVLSQLVAPAGGTSNVKQLQELGIKVVLSVTGSGGMGWDGVPADQNTAFAQWVQTSVIEEYGLDGIDIDNEWTDVPENPQAFMDTVGTLREYLGGSLITKALWNDSDYFTVPVSSSAPNVGAYLSSLLDFGSLMSYGSSFEGQIALVEQYHAFTANGQNVGLAWDQICIGVQAGPPPPYGSWMTPIDEVSQLAAWVVEPQSPTKPIPPILGMMLFTFSQDIQQWTFGPQNDPGHMYPNPADHQWQQAIVEGMWGAENWVVKTPPQAVAGTGAA